MRFKEFIAGLFPGRPRQAKPDPQRDTGYDAARNDFVPTWWKRVTDPASHSPYDEFEIVRTREGYRRKRDNGEPRRGKLPFYRPDTKIRDDE
jgi:hypothetical protein